MRKSLPITKRLLPLFFELRAPLQIKPVSVFISISVDGQNNGNVVLENAPETYIYSPNDNEKKYKFTVKVMGRVDAKTPNVSNLRYSRGQTISF